MLKSGALRVAVLKSEQCIRSGGCSVSGGSAEIRCTLSCSVLPIEPYSLDNMHKWGPPPSHCIRSWNIAIEEDSLPSFGLETRPLANLDICNYSSQKAENKEFICDLHPLTHGYTDHFRNYSLIVQISWCLLTNSA
jgi:hypothetical protein